MDERLKFIARLLDGDKMAALCREFGISRKTGYKIVNRYNDSGLEGLTDRSKGFEPFTPSRGRDLILNPPRSGRQPDTTKSPARRVN
jgi:hypothetical protein